MACTHLDLVLVMRGVVGGSIGSPAEVRSLLGGGSVHDVGLKGHVGLPGGEGDGGEGSSVGDKGGEKGKLHN